MDITVGGDFLGLCDQKSSYKHVSDFGRLRSYGHFLIPHTRPRVNRDLRNQLAGDVLNVVAYRLRNCNEQLAQFTTERRPVLRPAVHFRKPALSTDKLKLKVISRS